MNLLQKIPRLQDSLTSFSMTSVASQTHPSQPFCYPGSPPCPPWGFWVHWAVSYLHCLAFLQDVAQTPCILGSLPFPAPPVFREETKSQLRAEALLVSPEPCSSPDGSVPPGSPVLDRLPGMWPAPNFVFSSDLPGEKRVLPETHERGSSFHSQTSTPPPALLPSSQALP